jgi:hypothetical protein
VSGVTIVAISRNARRPTRKARTASRRRSSIGQAQPAPTQLPPQEPVLFQIREHLALPALEPGGQSQQEDLEGRGVHERELAVPPFIALSLTSRLADFAGRNRSIGFWDRTGARTLGLTRARHCYIRVICPGNYDVTLELSFPPPTIQRPSPPACRHVTAPCAVSTTFAGELSPRTSAVARNPNVRSAE